MDGLLQPSGPRALVRIIGDQGAQPFGAAHGGIARIPVSLEVVFVPRQQKTALRRSGARQGVGEVSDLDNDFGAVIDPAPTVPHLGPQQIGDGEAGQDRQGQEQRRIADRFLGKNLAKGLAPGGA